jgi:competence protein ComEC
MFKGKYLAGILTAYIAVFVLCFYFKVSPLLHFCATAVCLLVFGLSLFVKKCRVVRERKRIFLFLLAVILLVFSFGYSERFVGMNLKPIAERIDGKVHRIIVSVEDVRYEKAYASAYIVRVSEIDGEGVIVGALLELPFAGSLSLGDEISFESVITEIADEYRYYHKSQGVLVSLLADDFSRVGGKTVKPSVFERIRERIAENFKTHIGDGAGYATALLTGIKDDLDGQTRLAYQRLGISHVLAVSGMHFSVIVGGLDYLLRALTVPRKKKNMLLIVFSWIFALICGFSASVVRALIMFCLYYIADTMGEKSDSLTSLFFAAACIITVNPWAVYDAGFWLSVFSTFGIVLVMPSMNRILIGKKDENLILRLGKTLLRAALCMTVMNFTALFFTLPITYALYGGVSLISPLANLVFIPLTEGILYLLILLTLLGFVPFVAPLLGSLCAFLIAFADTLARMLSDMRGIYLSLRYPFAGVILVLMMLGVISVLCRKEFRARNMFAVFLASMLTFGVCLGVYTFMGKDATYLYLHTDGKNDVLSLVDDGEVMLIDATNGGKRVPQMAVDGLSDYYRCEIDTYVLTHLHSYHAGTLKTLADHIKIHRVLLPEAETEQDEKYLRAIAEALNGTCDIVYYKRNGEQTATVGETEIFLPDHETISRSEHPLLTVSAETNGVGAWIYCGSSSMENPAHWEDVKRYRTVIFGAHGPIVKNIFDDDCLSMAELVVFLSPDMEALVDAEKVNGAMALVDAEYHVRFEH